MIPSVGVILAAGALLGAFVLGYRVGTAAEHSARVAEVSTLRADANAHLAAAVEHTRQVEGAIIQTQSERLHEAQTQASAARADHDRAVLAGNSLQQRVTALAARCRPADPVAAVGSPGPAASAPGDLLAYVQRRTDAAAQGIAEFADAARTAGELCALNYEAARRALSGGP
jgi:hypothetical protein